jgi:2-methylaconitate cis-trans-isomerase PrpF
MRGGTSKAVFLRGEVLPPPGAERDSIILALFGSPDPRQIDGLGGADLLTSKLAIIDPPSRPDADVDYTFAQVSVTEPVVDYDINCGNISAAVGAFAVDEGLLDVGDPLTTVRIHNTNTSRILRAEVPIIDGAAAVTGDFVVHGVPGSGAPIGLDFSATAGGSTGSLLPTGNVTDELDTANGPVEASIVDLAMLTVYFPAAAVGLFGTEGPSEITADDLAAIAAVAEAAAKRLGMAYDGLLPVPAIVAAPAAYTSFATGETVAGDVVDLVARVAGGRPLVLHKAYPGTVGANTGVAACIAGTIVNQVTDQAQPGEVRIGHTSGVMPVRASVSRDGETWRVDEAVYHRTARRLAEGTAYIRNTITNTGAPDS